MAAEQDGFKSLDPPPVRGQIWHMFKIIGADGKEYGPIPADVLRQWIAEGRADAQSRILAEGATEWRPLSAFPEFSAVPPGNPPPAPVRVAYGPTPQSSVAGPAIALMITGALGAVLQALALVARLIWTPFLLAQQNTQLPPALMMMSGTIGAVVGAVNILIGLFIFFAAFKMKKLEGYTLAMTGSVLAMLPCVSPCCLLGLPFGIWALVVLNKPEVKSTFH